jgi:hypothetical protein
LYDKFDVIQNVVEACDQIRKAESRADAEKRGLLERTRWMWLNIRVNWTEKETQKWELVALERCVTGVCYQMSWCFKASMSGRRPRRPGSCTETGEPRCTLRGAKPENCSSRWPELPGWAEGHLEEILAN